MGVPQQIDELFKRVTTLEERNRQLEQRNQRLEQAHDVTAHVLADVHTVLTMHAEDTSHTGDPFRAATLKARIRLASHLTYLETLVGSGRTPTP